jgi:hypothetical protein
MSAVLEGDLRFFPTAQLLLFLAEHAHSGTLVVSSASQETRLFIHRGKIAWEEGNLPVLGVEEAVLEALAWHEGRFAFVEDASLPADRQSLDLDARPLVEEGQRRERERRRILDLYPDDRTTFRVAEEPSNEINLTPAEFKLIFRIGRGETLAQLCLSLGRPPGEIYPLIHNLEANGLISALAIADEEATRISRDEPASQPAMTLPAPEIRPRALQPSTPPRPVSQPEAPGNGATSVSPSRPDPSLDARGDKPRGQAISAEPLARAGDQATLLETGVSTRTLVGLLSDEAGSGGTHPLMSDEMIVGRDAANAVSLQDGSVSTRHARIARTPEGFTLEDLKSRNGTFVNGEQVQGKRILVDHDIIRFGRVVLTFNTAQEIDAGDRTIIGNIP